jgi:hypothetical protein
MDRRFIRILRICKITLLCIILTPTGLLSQTWEEYGSNPVFEGTPSGWNEEILCTSILDEGDTLKMWYTGYDGIPTNTDIGYAWSLDGIEWNDEGLCLEGTSSDLWMQSVLYDSLNARYMMWFNGNYSVAGYSTSLDGRTWATPELISAPSFLGSWDCAGMLAPAVIFEDGIFKAWYTSTSSACTGPYIGVGYATSVDGITWEKHPEMVFPRGINPGSWDDGGIAIFTVFRSHEAYEMYYHGWYSNTYRIGHAWSYDGLNWTHNPENPIVDLGDPGTWNSAVSSYPTVCPSPFGDGLWMWFSGASTTDPINRIGIAMTPTYDRIPEVPQELQAMELAGQIDLKWSPNQAYDIAHYQIYRNVENSSATAEVIGMVNTPDTSYADTLVTPDSTYFYYITAVDQGGQESGFSLPVEATPFAPDTIAPSQPEGFVAMTVDGMALVTLLWNANQESDLISYLLYKSSDPLIDVWDWQDYFLAQMDTATTSYVDTDVLNGSGACHGESGSWDRPAHYLPSGTEYSQSFQSDYGNPLHSAKGGLCASDYL